MRQNSGTSRGIIQPMNTMDDNNNNESSSGPYISMVKIKKKQYTEKNDTLNNSNNNSDQITQPLTNRTLLTDAERIINEY